MTETLYEKCSAVQDVGEYLKKTYCGSTGVEFSHVSNEDERLWCHETFERIQHSKVSDQEKIKAL